MMGREEDWVWPEPEIPIFGCATLTLFIDANVLYDEPALDVLYCMPALDVLYCMEEGVVNVGGAGEAWLLERADLLCIP